MTARREVSIGTLGPMPALPHPAQILLVTLAGFLNRRQGQILDYLLEENRVLKEQLRGRRLRLTNDQRRRLAAKGARLGRRVLARVATIVTPDTILRWHRQLIAAKWTFGNQRVGRPGVRAEIRELVLRLARDNATWGYCRIQGALANLGHRVAPTTIRKLLREHGVRPSPERPTSWRTFLRAHWQAIAATDFFTAEVWTATGLRTYYVLFVLELHTRRVHLAGITRNPDDFFMAAAAERALAFLRGIRFLIADRDTKFSLRFRLVLEAAGVRLIRTPFLAPNANAHAERFVRSIKSECLDRLILFGEDHLRRAVTEYLEHYHRERNHQGLGNELIEGGEQPATGAVLCDERLGGLLRFYRRAG